MTLGKGKRPRDPNQLAKWIVDQSVADVSLDASSSAAALPEIPVPADISQYMAAMGRKGGQIGGKRRLVTMTKEQRRKVAVKAAKARWGKKP
jgi:hypothetical protein